MIPGPFEYHRPGSVDEVIALLGKFGEDGRVIAGGHSLIPMMKLRLAEPAHLIDLKDVDTLRGIGEVDGTLRIGAMTTQAKLIASAPLALAFRAPPGRGAAAYVSDSGGRGKPLCRAPGRAPRSGLYP